MERLTKLWVLERSKQEQFRFFVAESIYRILVWNPSSIDFRMDKEWIIHVYKDDKDTRMKVTREQAEYFIRDRDQDEIVASHFTSEINRKRDNAYNKEEL